MADTSNGAPPVGRVPDQEMTGRSGHSPSATPSAVVGNTANPPEKQDLNDSGSAKGLLFFLLFVSCRKKRKKNLSIPALNKQENVNLSKICTFCSKHFRLYKQLVFVAHETFRLWKNEVSLIYTTKS